MRSATVRKKVPEEVAAGGKAGGPRPRLGFVGLGWIGLNRMSAVAASGAGEVVAVCDPVESCRDGAGEHAPGARRVGSYDDLLAMEPDAVYLATPSALHAEQAIRALRAGAAVFCQKPLGRDAAETKRVVDAARAADRRLGVDFSYRFTRAMLAVRDEIAAGRIGRVYAVDLVFHNAYGPDKDWFYDPARSGGGCLIDLGVHLVDLVFFALGSPGVRRVDGRVFAGGSPLPPERDRVEDHAIAMFDLDGGVTARLACSWNLPLGKDAEIEASFYGTEGAAVFRNVNGSFYDFRAERRDGERSVVLVEPPDDWGGRAAVDFARRVAKDPSYDPSVEEAVEVAAVLDAVYAS